MKERLPARTKELDDENSNTKGPRRGLREITERWRSVLPASAKTGDPNGPLEVGPLIRSLARLEDWVDENNAVRVIDAFVDALDLADLGFEGVEPEATGRPAYHPSTHLKL